MGMGKAFVALADDATATYWNPAGLAQIGRKEITALHTSLWGGAMYDYISYVNPVVGLGTIGMSWTQLSCGGFERRNEFNEITGTFKDTSGAYGISYGRQVLDILSIGANVKYMSHTLDSHANGNYLVDIGILYRPPVEGLQIGTRLQNVVSVETGEKTDVKLPLTMRIGMDYKLLKDRIYVLADAEYRKTQSGKSLTEFHGGVEFWALHYMAVRLGMDGEEFTAGLGLKYRDYGIDYAFATHSLGPSHRFSATLRFGPSMALASESRAIEYYKEAMAHYEKGFYFRAVEKLSSALSLDPKNTEIKEKLDKLEEISKVIPQQTRAGKEPDLVREGIMRYLENDVEGMLNIFRYLRSIEPENRSINEVIRIVKKKTGIEEPEEKLVKGMNLVDQKLSESLQSFYDGKYNRVVELCNAVIMIEPGNALAYKRIGSAYYAIGQKEKAVEAWEKSLKLNPADRSLLVFLKRAREEEIPVDMELDYLKGLEQKNKKFFE